MTETPAPTTPPTVPGEDMAVRHGTPEADATGGVIPYNNPCALTAYYLGLFSIIPVLGLFLGGVAFILGILGLRARKRNPQVRGSVHAWIGIIMGGFMMLVWGGVVVFYVVSMIMVGRDFW